MNEEYAKYSMLMTCLCLLLKTTDIKIYHFEFERTGDFQVYVSTSPGTLPDANSLPLGATREYEMFGKTYIAEVIEKHTGAESGGSFEKFWSFPQEYFVFNKDEIPDDENDVLQMLRTSLENRGLKCTPGNRIARSLGREYLI